MAVKERRVGELVMEKRLCDNVCSAYDQTYLRPDGFSEIMTLPTTLGNQLSQPTRWNIN